MSEPTTELIGPSGTGQFRLIACPTLSHERRQDQYVHSGRTLGECLRDLGWKTDGLHARVFIDGRYIPDAEWLTAEPKPGQSVVVRRVMRGGGGGTGKQIGMIVGMLALVLAAGAVAGGALSSLFAAEGLAMAFGSGTALANITAGAILVGGSLALNAFIAPSRPRLNDLSGAGNASSTLSLTGSANQQAPYARIPRVYGTHRVYPPLAAKPYTEVVGSNQYLRLLYCFGYGPLVLTSVRIGETPIEQFEHEKQIQFGYQGEPPLTLVPDDMIEESLQLKVTNAAGWIQRTSEANAKELSVDIIFPNGLVFIGPEDRKLLLRTVAVEVEYRKVGDSTWIPASGVAAAAASATTNFVGTNDDLVFTAKTPGSAGNAYIIYHYASTALKVERYIVQLVERGQPTSVLTYSINIYVNQGVTTAAQVKAAIEANPDTDAVVSVAFAPGNNGTGVISVPLVGWSWNTPMFGATFYMRGGRDQVPAFVVTGSTTALVRRSIRWLVNEPGNAFEIQMRRVTPDEDQTFYHDEVYWTMLRTIQTSPPVTKEGLCLLALRIKATDQLNGTVDTLNAVAQSVLLDWTGTEWTARATNNPASIYRDIMQGAANRRPKDDDQMDLTTIQAFHERCAAQGFAFNAVIDFQTTVKQLRQDVLAAARGTFGLRDMKYSVLEDLLQATPVDVITPRTTSSFKWTKRFLEMPHAFRVRFVDETNDWKQGERIVYADGYDATNATEFEDTEAGLGVTNPDQVWKLKRREFADAALRADDYEVQMDFANINVTRGDRVQLQHDVILAGLLTTRIKTVTLNGGSEATGMSFDDVLTMIPDTNYAARIRRATGAQVVQQITTVVGEQSSVTFTVPIPVGSVPSVGDVVIFGELGRESLDCIVKTIEPGPDYTATIQLQDYAPAIQTADTGTIPPYDPHLTLPVEIFTPIPTIVQVKSDESVLVRDLDGALQSRILISVHFGSGFRLPVTKLETQFRVTDSDEDWKVIFSVVVGTSVEVDIRPVEDGLLYDVRLRSVDEVSGAMSAWAPINGHEVIGKSSPPPDVTILVLEGTRLRWDYPNPPRDLAGFLVRFRPGTSRTWDNATPAHSQIILTTDFQILRQGATETFLVKAVDVAGNVSANPAVITVNYGDIAVDNLVFSTDHRALGWPGTITNGTIVSGDLVADTSGPFWTADADPAWPFVGTALYWDDQGAELTYEFSASPALDMLDATLKLDITMLGEWSVEYRSDSTALMWNAVTTTPMWNANAATLMWSAKGDYIGWPGQLGPLFYQQYDFRIVGQSGAPAAALQQLNVILDVIDVTETFPDFAVAPGGTRLPITKSYRSIVIVAMDLQDDTGQAAYIKSMDKDRVLGPLIQAFDSSNVTTGATADVTVQGY